MAHIFFDLDGTLVDSFPGIEYSAQCAVTSVLPDRVIPDFRSFIGPPIREVFRRALGEDRAEILRELELAFRKSYDGAGLRRTQAFPGVPEALATVRELGFQCHVLTNKPQRATQEILQNLSLISFFDGVVTPDSRLPAYTTKTEAALATSRKLGLSGPETLLVGDSADDAAAAAACGFRFAAVCFGYGNAHRECVSEVHFRLESFGELLHICEPLTILNR
ncbi:MAG: hypothetical protein JWN70_2593 [Planctomycetaceae bacterium]|nr:hypothetical protein [Planctomycetaceae bacterium]